MSTNKGIARFDPRTEAFRSFDASDGLQSDEFNRYAFCKAADGTLFFGGVNGLQLLPARTNCADDSTTCRHPDHRHQADEPSGDHRAEGSPLRPAGAT